MPPNPPSLDTAAASSGDVHVPIGARMIGTSRPRSSRRRAYMVGSTWMLAGGNAVVKWQLATYPLGEVAFGRTPLRIPDRRRDRSAARRVGCLADATLPRASAAPTVPV